MCRDQHSVSIGIICCDKKAVVSTKAKSVITDFVLFEHLAQSNLMPNILVMTFEHLICYQGNMELCKSVKIDLYSVNGGRVTCIMQRQS